MSKTNKSVNHYYGAAILAHGYSADINIQEPRKSMVACINILNLITFLQKTKAKYQNNINSDETIKDIIENIFDKHSNNNCQIIEDKSCQSIFRDCDLEESSNDSDIIYDIENRFLEFSKNKFIENIITIKNDKDIFQQRLSRNYDIYNYIRLTVARSPKSLLSENFKKNYKQFARDFPFGKCETTIMHFSKVNSCISDLSPCLLFTKDELTGKKPQEENNKHIIILPYNKNIGFVISRDMTANDLISIFENSKFYYIFLTKNKFKQEEKESFLFAIIDHYLSLIEKYNILSLLHNTGGAIKQNDD